MDQAVKDHMPSKRSMKALLLPLLVMVIGGALLTVSTIAGAIVMGFAVALLIAHEFRYGGRTTYGETHAEARAEGGE